MDYFKNEELDFCILKEEESSSKVISTWNEWISSGGKKMFSIFSIGDIVSVVFKRSNMAYPFEGLCVSKSGKKFNSLETSVTLSNVLLGVGIEVVFSYYKNSSFWCKINYYKKSQIIIKKSKLRYLGYKAGGKKFISF